MLAMGSWRFPMLADSLNGKGGFSHEASELPTTTIKGRTSYEMANRGVDASAHRLRAHALRHIPNRSTRGDDLRRRQSARLRATHGALQRWRWLRAQQMPHA